MHIAREQMLSLTLAKSQIPVCIFRPCGIYGAGDTHNAYGPTRFLRSAIKDHKIALFGNGEETRDHVYIQDVSELLRLCLVHRSAGIVNAVSGYAITFREVAAKICKLVRASVEIESLPRSGSITHRQFDVTERIRAFPDFVSTSLEEGLAATFRRLTTL
jgi:UDP-glucose 4-epimerase